MPILVLGTVVLKKRFFRKTETRIKATSKINPLTVILVMQTEFLKHSFPWAGVGEGVGGLGEGDGVVVVLSKQSQVGQSVL